MKDEPSQHLEHLLRTLGATQPITVKGTAYTLQQLVDYASAGEQSAFNRPTDTNSLVRRASRAILQLYYELHILRC